MYSTASTQTASVFDKRRVMNSINTNISQGSYRSWFFDLADWQISRAEFNSIFFNEGDPEQALLGGSFSFAYLREDKLRTIDIWDKDNQHVPFDQFLSRFGIDIYSKNLFKTGKYLSRVFRPVKHGAFFNGLDIYVNNNPLHSGKVTDGISLISIDLAKSLGWTNVEVNQSAQFTLFFDQGLVKGNCVVSDKIEHDIIIYGDENIKKEIKLSRAIQYVSLEPLKLGETLRMDIQSLLNLWPLFGPEQYLSWAYTGINVFEEDLFAGRLNDWLDDFDDISKEDYDKEEWTLRKAIWHKIDYTRFPGLIRLAWTMFKSSMIKFAENKSGQPIFRIPVPGGKRGYLRVDLRNHDKDGNFSASVQRNEVCLDKQGNLWIHPEDINDMLNILGGADQDDSCGVVPIEDNKALIYRNPNQYGEFYIQKIKYENVEIKKTNKLCGGIDYKRITKVDNAEEENTLPKNDLLKKFLNSMDKVIEMQIPYTRTNLLRTYNKISQNSANIGLAANAEMIRSVIQISSPGVFKRLLKKHSWNLERIIDSTVKEGINCDEDMNAVNDFFEEVVKENVSVPESIVHRFPEKYTKEVKRSKNHLLDQLLEGIKFLIKQADKEILGDGSHSRGNRVPGRIDYLDIPVIEIGVSNVNNELSDLAINYLKGYNKEMAILIESTKDLPMFEQEEKRRTGINSIQESLCKKLERYSKEEKLQIVKCWAYEIYKTNKCVHDSILWIGNKNSARGISDITIEMLSHVGIGWHVKSNGSLSRYNEIKPIEVKSTSIRVWSKEELRAEDFESMTEIYVENKKVILGEGTYNLGDECVITDGIYNIKTIVQSISKKNTNLRLKNSLTIYLL